MKNFLSVNHTADMQVQVFGATWQELFLHAMQAVFSTMHVYCQDSSIHRDVVITSAGGAHLLVDFLSEVIALSDAYHEVYQAIDFYQITERSIRATLKGGTMIVGQDGGVEIKAVTYHNLSVVQKNGLWEATIVFDI